MFYHITLKLGQRFSQFMYRFKTGILSVVLRLQFQIIPIHKEILGFLNVARNVALNVFQTQYVYRGPNLWSDCQFLRKMNNNINFPSLNENKNCKNFWGLHHSNCTAVCGTNHTHSPTPHFNRFPIWNDIFPIIAQCIIFYFWDRPWYSDECARRLHYIHYLDSLGLA